MRDSQHLRTCALCAIALLAAACGGGGSSDGTSGNGEFRATSLRNIAVTGPYMHDGRFTTLRQVIDHYDSGVQASAQLSFLLRDHHGAGSDFPRRLNMTGEQKQALEAFLNTLTDDALLNDPKFSDPFQ